MDEETGPVVRPARLSQFAGQRNQRVVMNWLFEVETKVLPFASSEREGVNVAMSYLTDTALQWLRGLPVRPENWAGFRTVFMEQFLPADYKRRARDALHGWRQTRGVAVYAAEFRDLVLACEDVGAAEALDKFTRGLKPAIAFEVMKENPSSLDEACRVALCAEDAFVAARRGSPSSQGLGIHHRSGPTRAFDVPYGESSAPMEIGAQAMEVTCYNCEERGHFARDCPKPHRARAQAQPGKGAPRRD